MKGYVYAHISPSGKYYIGQTIKEPQERWGQNGGHYNGSPVFYQAIKKYGWGNIKHIILEEIENDSKAELVDLLNQWEIYYINIYNSLVPYGYNVTKGGNNVPERIKRKICQYDKNKKLVKIWDSALEASKSLDLKQGHTNIIQCCKHKQYSCGNYFWEYEGNPCSPKKIKRDFKRKVAMLDENKKIIQIYESAADAARDNNLKDSSGIIKCCKGVRKRAGGFGWQYWSEVTEE